MASKQVTIAVVSSRQDDLRAIRDAMAAAGIQASCRLCGSIEELRTQHESERFDLVAYWHANSPVTDKALRECLANLPESPQLLLFADRVTAQDYVRAASLRADDVASPHELARLGLIMNRTVTTLEIRRQLEEVHKRLARREVVDPRRFPAPDGPDAIPPLVDTIDQALRTDTLHLVFQPIIPVHDDDCELFEAFVRIRTDDGDIMPGEFLPVATQYGLLPAIDRWVLRNAVKRFVVERARRRASGRDLYFVLNVSAHTLVEERAAQQMLKIIAHARPNPGAFIIKLDKNTILTRLSLAKSLNRMVKKVGLQFAIDHYEASDTRLNFLDHVDVDFIKLHGSLIKDIDQDESKCRQAEEVVTAARKHNIRVIAGQVERANELATLYRIGVDYVQGYLIGEPDDEIPQRSNGAEVFG